MIGIDVVDVPRLARALARIPRVERRLFTARERSYCNPSLDPATRFAGTLAAKEAVVKALGLSSIHQWAKRIEILRSGTGPPVALLDGNAGHVSLSISHDGGVAVAVALAQQDREGG